jgi:hypothetical protein
VRVFAFVAAQKADFSVTTLCRVCQVSTSGYYAYEAREVAGPSPAALAKAAVAGHVARVHKGSRRRYGSPRVTVQLAREGIVVNHKAVEAEMARQGLVGRCSRRKMRTTRRDPSRAPASDLVERDFERAKVDELWIGDATYIWTDEGWCFLATVIDACSRRLLGWSITDHLRTALCLDALKAAVATRGGRTKLALGVVFHTDHGSSTPPTPSPRLAARLVSPNRWEPSVTATTMPWPSRSSRASSAKSAMESTSPHERKPDAKSSSGSTGTTQRGFTVRSTTAHRSSMKSTS